MATLSVRNADGQTYQVDDEHLADAQKDGYLPVVSNGKDEHRVSPDEMHLALKDGFVPVTEGQRSPMLSAIDKYIAGATAGFGPKIFGAANALGRAVGVEGVSGPMNQMSLAKGGPTLDPDTLSKSYAQGRDQFKADLIKDSIDNPGISKTAEIGGMLTSPVNKLAAGTSLAGGGALIGGINAAGNSDADSAAGLLKDTATGAGLGAAGGAVIGKVGGAVSPYIQKGAQAVGSKFNDLAETQAFKATGAMLKDFRAANGNGAINDTGRFLLDNGIVQAGDTVDSVAAKADAFKAKAGQKLDQIYSVAQKGVENATPEQKAAIDAAGFNPVRDKDEILAAAKDKLGSTVGKKAAIGKLSDYLDELAEEHGNTTLSPKDANDVKSAIDQTIKYSRNPVMPDPASEQAFYAARKSIADKIAAHVDTIGEASGSPNASAALKQANQDYGMSKRVSDIANDRVNRESANQTLSLTDKMAAGATGIAAAAELGGPMGAVAAAGGAVGSKLVRKYGSAATAGALENIGNMLSKTPEMQAVAQKNPVAFQAAIQKYAEKLDENGGLSRFLPGKAAGQSRPANDDQPPADAAKPTKGPDKWAGDGFENLIKHSDDAKSLDRQALMQDPKAKQLLITASDLKPGSKAMQTVLEKLQKGQK